MTSLHWAAQNGHTDTVKILIDHKANVSTKDRYGKKDNNTYIQGVNIKLSHFKNQKKA